MLRAIINRYQLDLGDHRIASIREAVRLKEPPSIFYVRNVLVEMREEFQAYR